MTMAAEKVAGTALAARAAARAVVRMAVGVLSAAAVAHMMQLGGLLGAREARDGPLAPSPHSEKLRLHRVALRIFCTQPSSHLLFQFHSELLKLAAWNPKKVLRSLPSVVLDVAGGNLVEAALSLYCVLLRRG